MRPIKVHINPGDKFAYLTVTEFAGKGPYGHWMYKCNCDCGNNCIVQKAKLVSGHTKSCGCWNALVTTRKNQARKGKYRREIGDYFFRKIKASYLGNASSRGLMFSLTDEQLGKLIDSRCFYCGGGFENSYTIAHRAETIFYNGIDRVDNKKGYEPDNCVPCCFKCNRAKDTMSRDEFIAHIFKIFGNLSKEFKKNSEEEERMNII